MNFCADCRSIDVKNACVHFVHSMESAVYVLRVDGCRQSVAYSVADINRWIVADEVIAEDVVIVPVNPNSIGVEKIVSVNEALVAMP